jgi:hypothetical protein
VTAPVVAKPVVSAPSKPKVETAPIAPVVAKPAAPKAAPTPPVDNPY